MSINLNRIDIELSSNNYTQWSDKMESLLVLRDLDDILTQVEPENPIDSDDDSDHEDEEQVAKLRIYRKWKKESAKVRALILLNIDKHNALRIQDIKGGAEAWDVLKKYHKRGSLANMQRLQEKISTLKKRPGMSMEQHLDYLFELVSRYKEAGGEYGDAELVNRMLNSIRSTHKNLCDSIGIQSSIQKDPWELRLWLIDYDMTEGEEVPKPLITEIKTTRHDKQVAYKVERDPDDWSEEDVPPRMASEVHVVPKPANRFANYICNGCKQKGHIRVNCPYDKLSISQLETMLKNKRGNKANAAGNGQNYTSCVIESTDLHDWVIDSGATAHMTPKKSLFSEINSSHRSKVTVADGKQIEAKGIGTVQIKLHTNEGVKVLLLKNVLFVLQLKTSLFSIREFTAEGGTISFDANKVYLTNESEEFLIGRMEMSRYMLCEGKEAMFVDQLPCKHELHKRFAHRNLRDIEHMIVLGLPSRKCNCSDVCEDCLKGKMAKRPFKAAKPVEDVLDVVVSDVHGPMPVETPNKKRYFITFIDVKSRYCEVKFIRQKSDVSQCTIEFIEQMKTQHGKKPKVFRSDRGTEYMDQRLQNYLANEGIWYETTVGYCAEQNGIAERRNRTLKEAATTMLSDSNLPRNHWAEAIAHANYCQNRTISRSSTETPIEMFCGRKPDWSKMRKFGSEVFVMIPAPKQQQLKAKSEKMKFVGFDQHAKGFRVSNGARIILSREVRFTEDIDKGKRKERPQKPPKQKRTRKVSERRQKQQSNPEQRQVNEDFFPVGFDIFPDVEEEPDVLQAPPEQAVDEEDNESVDSFHSAEDQVPAQPQVPVQAQVPAQVQVPAAPVNAQPPALRRSTRTTAGKLPQRFNDYVLESTAMFVSNDPRTDRQAMASNEAQHWEKAKHEELDAIRKNKTWDVMDLPPGKRAIGSKWVFKTKTSSDGSVQYKARLVAQGFTQQFGTDFKDVFAPVANSTTMRVLLTVAGIRKYEVRHYDVKSAFLNGELEEEIYMKPPPGVNENGKVYRLRKSLYGLKQAANVWNRKLHDTLVNNGSVQSKDDDCLYSYASGGVRIYLLIHVDDILAVSNSTPELVKFMSRIGREFEIKDLGRAQTYLGIDLHRNEEGFFELSQTEYIDKMLEVMELQQAKTSKIPMDTGYHKLSGEPLTSNENYRKLIGMLLYISVNTRPDIAAAVAILCQKVSAPTCVDLNEAKRVLCYLKGTKSMRLKLGTSDRTKELCAFSDSDWAECQVDRKSNSGIVCFFNNAPVMWKSKKQTIVATSSAEAEYVALSLTVKELIWLRRLIESFDIHQNGPLNVYSDSQSAIAMVTNPKLSSRTKHIDTKYHHVKDSVHNNVIKLIYVSTDNNIADVLTKPLANIKLMQFRSSLGLTSDARIEEECWTMR
jgi:transposase InsO family protein